MHWGRTRNTVCGLRVKLYGLRVEGAGRVWHKMNYIALFSFYLSKFLLRYQYEFKSPRIAQDTFKTRNKLSKFLRHISILMFLR